jgi:methyltransferase
LSFLNLIGAPQIAAVLVLIQRGAEELYSARNTRVLIAAGAREVGQDFYSVVAATHLAWIASLLFLMPPQAPILWPLIYYYLTLQLVRYWVIAGLGRYWPTPSSPLPMRRSSPAAPIAISATRTTP